MKRGEGRGKNERTVGFVGEYSQESKGTSDVK